MFERFPRLVLKENRKVLSMQDARLWIGVAKEQRKLCLFGLYAFERWQNDKPFPNSVILDVIALKGEKVTLAKLGKVYLKEGRESLFMFDGQYFLLIVEHDGTPLEKVKEPAGTVLIRNVMFKFTYPNTYNGRTGKKSEIIKRFKNEA